MRISGGNAAARCTFALGLTLLAAAATASTNSTLVIHTPANRAGGLGSQFAGAVEPSSPWGLEKALGASPTTDALGSFCRYMLRGARTEQAPTAFSIVAVFDPPYPQSTRDIALLEMDVETINNLPDKPAAVVFGGDIVLVDGRSIADADTYFARLKGIVADLDMPFLPVLGNHDMCLTQAYSKRNPALAKESYIRNMGPTYYSFDQGEFHFVVLDIYSIDLTKPTAGASLVRKLPSAELTWLASDLAAQPAGTPIMFIAHEWPPSGWADQRFWNAVAPYNIVGLIAGHTHYFVGGMIRNPVNQRSFPAYSFPASYGSKWITRLNRDYTPRGWATLYGNGTNLAKAYGPADSEGEISILSPQPEEEVGTGKLVSVRAQVCLRYPIVAVKCRFDGKALRTMTGDPFEQIYELKSSLSYPAPGRHSIAIEATDSRGQLYRARTMFEVRSNPYFMFRANYVVQPLSTHVMDIASGLWEQTAQGYVGRPEPYQKQVIAVGGRRTSRLYTVGSSLAVSSGYGGLLSSWYWTQAKLIYLLINPAKDQVWLAYRPKFPDALKIADTASLRLDYNRFYSLRLESRPDGTVVGFVNGKQMVAADLPQLVSGAPEPASEVEGAPDTEFENATTEEMELEATIAQDQGRFGVVAEGGGTLTLARLEQMPTR